MLSPLICFAVHPVSFDLMCLTENGCVFQLIETAGIENCPIQTTLIFFNNLGSCRQQLFIKLNDFCERYPSPKHWFSYSTIPDLELFFLHTYLGICHRGELRYSSNMYSHSKINKSHTHIDYMIPILVSLFGSVMTWIILQRNSWSRPQLHSLMFHLPYHYGTRVVFIFCV